MRYNYLFLILLSFFILTLSCSTKSSAPMYQLTLTSEPEEGGTVTPVQGEFEEGDQVEISAQPNEHWLFEGWQGDHAGSNATDTITMDSDKDIAAVFMKRDYPLTIETVGEGSVTEEVIQAKSTDYPHGTVVELTAEPETGWHFVRWEGDLEGDENPETITIEEETEVTAVFEQIEHSLTVNIIGEGEVDQEVVQAKTTEYPEGTAVELTAIPNDDWFFSSWNDEMTGNPIILTVVQDTTITASFITTAAVNTQPVTEITQTSAVSGGEITDDGGAPVTARGVCYSQDQNPTLDDECTDDGSGGGDFSSSIGGLKSGTEYYVKAYAVNDAGTSYGEEIGFVTEAESGDVPRAPTIDNVIAGDRELTVYFSPPADDGGSPITHYEYRLNVVSGDPDVDIGLSSPFTIKEGLNDGNGHYEIINGEEYIVRLRAVNAVGPGPRTTFGPVIPEGEETEADIYVYALAAPDLTSEIFINWIDDSPDADGSVQTLRYGTGTPFNREISATGRKIPHANSWVYSARLTDLNPATAYSGRVHKTESRHTDLIRFETLPVSISGADEVKIAFVSDIHIENDEPGSVTVPGNPVNSMNDPARMRFVEEKKLDLLCIVGDIVSNGYWVDETRTEQYLGFFRDHIQTYLNAEKLIPLFVVPGNHEVGFPLRQEGGITEPSPGAGYFQLFFNNLYETTGHMHLKFRSKPWTVIETETPPSQSLELGHNQYLVVDESRNRMVEFGQGYRSNRTPYTSDDKTWYIDDASVAQYNVFFTVALQDGRHIVTEYNHDGSPLYSKDLREGGE